MQTGPFGHVAHTLRGLRSPWWAHDFVNVKSSSTVHVLHRPRREVRDLPTLKAALMADKERILKGIIGKLVSYAHGHEATRADRPYIDAVYQASKAHNYSLRSAIHAIVAHPEFGRK